MKNRLAVTSAAMIAATLSASCGDDASGENGGWGRRGPAVVPAVEVVPTDELDAFVADRAETLRDSAGDDSRLVALAQSVAENADGVRGSLSGARFGQFEVISAALNFNYSWKLYAARRLRAGEGGDDTDGDEADLSADQQSALDDLIEALELFGPTREHFKTLYFQWELVDLSRVILVASIPALVVSAFMVLYYEVGTLPALVPGVPTPVLVVSVAIGFAVLPFAVLLSYVLRIATVALETSGAGPFALGS